MVSKVPRYFFDYLNHPDLNDQAGADLPNDAAARQEALLRAQDLKSRHSLIVFDDTDEIAVRRENGEHFFKVRLR